MMRPASRRGARKAIGQHADRTMPGATLAKPPSKVKQRAAAAPGYKTLDREFSEPITVTEFNFEHSLHREGSGQARYLQTPVVYGRQRRLFPGARRDQSGTIGRARYRALPETAWKRAPTAPVRTSSRPSRPKSRPRLPGYT